jgi:hypothetical protein
VVRSSSNGQGHPDPTLRQTMVKHGYEMTRTLKREAGEVLGPPVDSHRLTAQEEEFAWDEPDHQQYSLAQKVWAEEVAAAKQTYPDLSLEDAIEEARPHVGARLFPFRVQMIGGSDGLDIRDQQEAADKIMNRARKRRAGEYDQQQGSESNAQQRPEPTEEY